MDIQMSQELKEYNRIYKEIDNIYHDIAVRLGLSDSAFDILYSICDLGDGCLQKDICSISHISKQTINSSIRRLEKDGYLTLKAGKGRQMHIHLTSKGESLIQEKILPVIKIESRTFEEMTTEECWELLKLNKKYMKNFHKNVKEFLL